MNISSTVDAPRDRLREGTRYDLPEPPSPTEPTHAGGDGQGSAAGSSDPPAQEPAPRAPSFAALMGSFRAEHHSEVQAAAALLIGATTLSDYCHGRSLPTASGIKRLAPALGIPADELAVLVEAQRAAMQRGESIPTVAPVLARIRRRQPLANPDRVKPDDPDGTPLPIRWT